MKSAIVTGAAGFVGSAVVNKLLSENINVIALGRTPLNNIGHMLNVNSRRLTYIQLDLVNINRLLSILRSMEINTLEECVFYHFAWSGNNSLADGTVEDQIRNSIFTANAVKIAKTLGCDKFVNVGTIEETFLEKYLVNDWQNKPYHSNLSIYGVAKLASRDMGRLVAYLDKIDYIHTRFSVLIDPSLKNKGYIPETLNKILKGESFIPPRNHQLFDFLPVDEGAKAFYLIGEKGVNKSDYFIGSGSPKTLTEYFHQFMAELDDKPTESTSSSVPENLILTKSDFSINSLKKDTGFIPQKTNNDIFKQIIKKHE